MLTVDCQPVAPEEMHRYAVRFYQSSEGPAPVLYFDGKRVTRAWRLEMAVDVPADRGGESANTA
jgi:hypothetical protein